MSLLSRAPPTVRVKKLHPDAKLPEYAHRDDAGADLSSVENVRVWPKSRTLVRTGIIDEGYTGEVMVLIHNHGNEPFEVNAGDRIGQMLIVPYWQATFEEVEQLPAKGRSTAGFGSTGT